MRTHPLTHPFSPPCFGLLIHCFIEAAHVPPIHAVMCLRTAPTGHQHEGSLVPQALYPPPTPRPCQSPQHGDPQGRVSASGTVHVGHGPKEEHISEKECGEFSSFPKTQRRCPILGALHQTPALVSHTLTQRRPERGVVRSSEE